MTAVNVVTFWDRLVNSQLLDPDQLAACREAVGEDERPAARYLVDQGWLTRFQARQLRAGATSFIVGKYVVLDCIGRGANGIVFKARHRLMANRLVAMKTIDTRSLHHEGEAVERFRREIDIVARLDHANVVRAYDVLQTRTQLYLVLEYVSGKDLARVVKERGRLPVAEAVDYAVQAARGLQYAHAQGIVHRDLKPANLLLTEDGVVKLSDLGLARLFSKDAPIDPALKGMALGTPEFMAPEQAEDAESADPRSDLYSLGATLFHLLTAELPVTGSSYLHRLQTLLTLPPKPLGEARPDAPAELAAVVDRLRSRRREDRPSSAEEVIALLEPFAKAEKEDPGQWDAKRRFALVLELLRGQVTPEAVAGRYGLAIAEVTGWQQRALDAAERSLDPNPPPAVETVELREMHAKIGAQAMEIEALKRRLSG